MKPELEFLIACGALEDLLEEDERAQLEAARADDPEVAARIAELEAAYAALQAEPEPAAPAALWARIEASVEAGERFEDEQPPTPELREVTISLACSYCHDGLVRAAAAYCASCLAPHHRECFAEHGRCSAPGCGETHWVRARQPEPARRASPLLPLLFGVLGLGAAALTAGVAAWGGIGARPVGGGEVVVVADASPPPQVAAVVTAVEDPGPVAWSGARVLWIGEQEVVVSRAPDDGLRVGRRCMLAAGPDLDVHAPSWTVQVVAAAPHVARCVRVDFGASPPQLGHAVLPLDTGSFEAPPLWGVGVYYLDGLPGPRFQHLSRYLCQDSGALAQTFLEDADPGWEPPTSSGAAPLERARASAPVPGVVVLGPTRHAAAPHDLRAFVLAGGGLILLGGERGQVRDLGAEAALLSPVADVADAPRAPSELPPRVSPELASLAGVDGLPALAVTRATRLRPGARALLRDGEGRPAIAQWSVGRGQVLYVGTRDLWTLKRLEAPQGGGATRYHALWAELCARASRSGEEPAARVVLDSPGTGAVVRGELRDGTRLRVDLLRRGTASLIEVGSLRGRAVGGRVTCDEPTSLELPPGRYGWRVTAEGRSEALLGVGWSRVGEGAHLTLRASELRTWLECALRAWGPDYAPHELSALRQLAGRYLAEGPQLAAGQVELLRGLADGARVPDEAALRAYVAAGEVPLEREVFGRVGEPRSAEERLRRWELFAQCEWALALDDPVWLAGLAADEVAELTLGSCWAPPAVPGVAAPLERALDRSEPPWAYVLGHLPQACAVAPRWVPPRYPVWAREASAIDPRVCLARDGRPASLLRLVGLEGGAERLGSLDEGGLEREAWLALQAARLDAALAAVAESAPAAPMGGRELGESPDALQALDLLQRTLRLVGELEVVGLRDASERVARSLTAATWSEEERTIQRDLVELSRALSAYRRDLGRYPASLGHLTLPPHASDPQRGAWAGPYLFSWRPGGLADDPWDLPYRYYVLDADAGFELETLGLDAQEGGSGLACDRRWRGR